MLFRSFSALSEVQKMRFNEDYEMDFAYELKGIARFRGNTYLQRGNVGGAFRVIPYRIKTMEELGLPPSCKDFAQRPRGLVLVTGPAGSGKSTTQAAMIDFINRTDPVHIITIEDPVEFVHTDIQAVINQRELETDTMSFPNALRAALREDPDVILIGEMRDLETIKLAITAAETGHLVFGTLHTTGAQGTVDRIIDVFPTNQQEQIRTQLSTAIIGVLSQQLLPRKPKGVVAAYEFLVVTSAIANLIREGKTFRINSAIQTGRKHGMQLMDDALFSHWKMQLCEEADVINRANNPAELREKIAKAKKGLLEDDAEEGDEEA